MRVVVLAFLLLAPLAAAGTPEDPEIVDPAGDASPPAANQWADLTAAWLEEGAGGSLSASMQLSAFLRAPPLTAYLVLFDVGEASWYAVVVFLDDGAPRYYVGEWDREAGMPTSETEVAGSVQGTLLRVDFHRADVGAENATALTALEAGVFDFKTASFVGALPMWLDTAEGQRDFPLASLAPDAGGAQVGTDANEAPAAPLALVVAGAAAVALLRRRA